MANRSQGDPAGGQDLFGPQSDGALLFEPGDVPVYGFHGVPNDAVGPNGAWALSDNGHAYVKAAGAWALASGFPTGAAGGDLAGAYPNPTVKALAITDAKVAAANKDGAANVPSLRTLGVGAAQAAAGNDGRFHNLAAAPLALPADATDPASTQALANALRAALITLDLGV